MRDSKAIESDAFFSHKISMRASQQTLVHIAKRIPEPIDAIHT
jgi:hypothetical protein